MDAEEIDTAAAAAELNILGGLASVTGLQSPAPLDFGITVDKVAIMEDNQACVQISKNPVHHQRTKHISKYYMYLRDMCLAGEIELVGCGTAVQVADIHTKGLERTKFQAFRDVMCGYRTYNDLISEDPETVSTVRRIAQRKLEEELEYVETDSVYSYRL